MCSQIPHIATSSFALSVFIYICAITTMKSIIKLPFSQLFNCDFILISFPYNNIKIIINDVPIDGKCIHKIMQNIFKFYIGS